MKTITLHDVLDVQSTSEIQDGCERWTWWSVYFDDYCQYIITCQTNMSLPETTMTSCERLKVSVKTYFTTGTMLVVVFLWGAGTHCYSKGRKPTTTRMQHWTTEGFLWWATCSRSGGAWFFIRTLSQIFFWGQKHSLPPTCIRFWATFGKLTWQTRFLLAALRTSTSCLWWFPVAKENQSSNCWLSQTWPLFPHNILLEKLWPICRCRWHECYVNN